MIRYMKNGVSNQVDAAAQTIRRLKEIDPCPTCLIKLEPKLSKGAADEILTDATSVGDIMYLDFAGGATKLGEFKSWGKKTLQRAFGNTQAFRQLTDYCQSPLVDDIGKMVYDFDGRKLLKDITGNANHFATKGEAELFIKGELSKVLVTKDAATGLVIGLSGKGEALFNAMTPGLKGKFGWFDGMEEADELILKNSLFGDVASEFYKFIQVK
jgi:hypothetical protein